MVLKAVLDLGRAVHETLQNYRQRTRDASDLSEQPFGERGEESELHWLGGGSDGVFKKVFPIGNPTVIRLNPLPSDMADDKQGRDEQADDEKRRQRERMQEDARTRTDEEEPMRVDPGEQLGDLDQALKSHDYPATTNELVEAYGDYELETQGGKKSLEDVLYSTENQKYDSTEDIRRRILGLIGR